jgi:hypothetical protein
MRVTQTSQPGGNNEFLRFLNSDDAPFPKAKELRKEILGDILPIISPERKLQREEVQSLLERLLEKINSLNLRPEWQAARFRPGDPKPVWGGTAKIQGYRWAIIRAAKLPPGPTDRQMRDVFYMFIAAALETGKLTELRKCEACNKIFAIDDPRRKFCSDKCRIAFNNEHRLQAGYFSDLRKRKRRIALVRVGKLLGEGKSPEDALKLVKNTGLSLGLLKRAGLVKDTGENMYD